MRENLKAVTAAKDESRSVQKLPGGINSFYANQKIVMFHTGNKLISAIMLLLKSFAISTNILTDENIPVIRCKHHQSFSEE